MQDMIARETARPAWAEITERLEREATADFTTDDVLAAIDEGRQGR
ncbi:hypothetical protein ACX6XY_19340 [Streptomyces sp. O3]